MALLRDIRFWILVFFLLRLIGITDPPLEVAHNWRQTTVTMVARNFLEVEADILRPRIDIGGETSGITAMEFPLLNYLIYLAALIFGYDHWYGRPIVLLISSFGVYYFHRIISRYFGERTAFFAAMILLSSIWFAYSRKIMPDTFSVSFILFGLYHGLRYLDRFSDGSRIGRPLFFMIGIMAGSLSKLPSAILLPVLLIPMFDGRIPAHRKVLLIGAGILAISPAVWWYFHWSPMLVERYGFAHFFMGKGIAEGAQEIILHRHDALKKFYEDAMKFSGGIAFLAGVVLVIMRRERRSSYVLLLSSIPLLVVMLKSGFTFTHHSYYIIPFVPVMALFAGHAVQAIPSRKLAMVLLGVIMLEGLLNQIHDLRIKEKDRALLSLEKDLDLVTSRDELILINSGAYPTPMYFAHRRGWVAKNEEVDTSFLDSLSHLGLRHVVIMRRTFGTEMELPLPVLLETEDHRIHTLTGRDTDPIPSAYGR